MGLPKTSRLRGLSHWVQSGMVGEGGGAIVVLKKSGAKDSCEEFVLGTSDTRGNLYAKTNVC